jgi:hypothetical protein
VEKRTTDTDFGVNAMIQPAVESLLAQKAWRWTLAAAAVWSVFVQVLGVLAYTPAAWNAGPLERIGISANIDLPQHGARLWSFTDWQIGYLIANFSTARLAGR